jgi:hypothetical protein
MINNTETSGFEFTIYINSLIEYGPRGLIEDERNPQKDKAKATRMDQIIIRASGGAVVC